MKPAPHVHIAKDKLSGECGHCLKRTAYQRGTHIDRWNRELQAFIGKHNECKKEKI